MDGNCVELPRMVFKQLENAVVGSGQDWVRAWVRGRVAVFIIVNNTIVSE